MQSSSTVLKYAVLGLVVIVIPALLYKSMCQYDYRDSTFPIMFALNHSIIMSSESRVEPAKFELIRQGASEIRLHSKITARSFSKLLQINNKEKLYQDTLNRNFNIIPAKIEIFEDMIIIEFVVQSEPFRLKTPSVLKLQLFSYSQIAVDGFVCFNVKRGGLATISDGVGSRKSSEGEGDE